MICFGSTRKKEELTVRSALAGYVSTCSLKCAYSSRRGGSRKGPKHFPEGDLPKTCFHLTSLSQSGVPPKHQFLPFLHPYPVKKGELVDKRRIIIITGPVSHMLQSTCSDTFAVVDPPVMRPKCPQSRAPIPDPDAFTSRTKKQAHIFGACPKSN